VLEALHDKGVLSNTGICPEIYLEEAFKNYPYKISGAQKYTTISRLPHAKKLGETSMAFLVHPTLDIKAVHYVIDQVKMVMEKACR